MDLDFGGGAKSTRDEQTHVIIGAAMEVHRQLGPGFLEAGYQAALAVEFAQRQIAFNDDIELPVYYKSILLPCSYKPDFVCFESIIIELKALQAITGVEDAQVLNYLKATRLERGLILNFGRPSLEFKRLIFSNQRKSARSEDGSVE
jgi:GxxExxY protein